jgi:hypothetical protein
MDELVFTNPKGPKVTYYQERRDTAGWALFNETWPPSVETLIIVRQGMTAGMELVMSNSHFRSEGRLGERERMLKNSSKNSYG